MSRDQRWTGGAANREWQSGTAVEQPVDNQAILGYVRDYLDDCQLLSPAHHPTERGALQVVWAPTDRHKQVVWAPTDRHKQVVAAAFRHLTRGGLR